MNRRLCVRLACLLLILSPAAGCKQSAGIHGRVTYRGQPVSRGTITFSPDDGVGPTCGGLITDGRYQVADVTPGKKRVQIVGVKAVKFAHSHEEMARAAKEAASKGDATGIIDRADVIPADADGNNVVIELAAGGQTRDFELRQPR
jgi:hypothetical protein